MTQSGAPDGKEFFMMLDKRSVEMLLKLSDDQLVAVIRRLAADAGVDIGGLNISHAQIQGIRQALSVATDDDLKRASDILGGLKGSKGKQ